jgi:hypothetical protein
MNKIGVIVGIIMAIFSIWYIVNVSTPRLMEANENVRIAEEEVAKAKAEYAETEQRIDNILKYNCAKPVFSESGVLCPNG